MRRGPLRHRARLRNIPGSLRRRLFDAARPTHQRKPHHLGDAIDRTIGVEAFDTTYGVGFQASDDSPHALECELVEAGGAFLAQRPTNADRPGDEPARSTK